MFVMGPKVLHNSFKLKSSFGSGMFVMGPKVTVGAKGPIWCFGSGMFVMGPKERGNYSKPD